MRIVDDELKRLMEEYRFFHEIKNASEQLKRERNPIYQKEVNRIKNRELSKKRIAEEQNRVLRSNLELLNLSDSEREAFFSRKRVINKQNNQEEYFRKIRKKYKRTINGKKQKKHITDCKWIDKYSGIEAHGDSGREPRKEDWNDEIARHFQRELRRTRNIRRQMGIDGIDRGALK